MVQAQMCEGDIGLQDSVEANAEFWPILCFHNNQVNQTKGITKQKVLRSERYLSLDWQRPYEDALHTVMKQLLLL